MHRSLRYFLTDIWHKHYTSLSNLLNDDIGQMNKRKKVNNDNLMDESLRGRAFSIWGNFWLSFISKPWLFRNNCWEAQKSDGEKQLNAPCDCPAPHLPLIPFLLLRPGTSWLFFGEWKVSESPVMFLFDVFGSDDENSRLKWYCMKSGPIALLKSNGFPLF